MCAAATIMLMPPSACASAPAAFSAPQPLSPRRLARVPLPPACSSRPPVVCAKKRPSRRRKRSEPSSPKPSAPQSSSQQRELPKDDTDDVTATEQLPLADESRLTLPDLKPASRRRRRKPLQKPVEHTEQEREVLATDAVQRLTAAYRAGGKEAQKVIDELEKDPDYFLQTGNAKGEYDFASALIGTGRPNKQGVYVLPYLQSGHVLLLGITLLVALVYYPGFPLTEASDETRQLLKSGLALVATANAVLAVYAYRAAKLRAQPPFFWAVKTFFLGNLAFNELRTNAPIVKDGEK